MKYWLLLIAFICCMLITLTDGVSQAPVKRKPFKAFIDSLTNTTGLRFDNKKPAKVKIDTIFANGQYQIVRNNGLVKQYYKLKDKSTNVTDLDNCNSFLGIGKKVFLKDTMRCWTRFEYDAHSSFSYNSASFITGMAEPADDCSGSLCRVYTYAVIAKFGADTSVQYLSYTDNITGLRYGDINHDGWLDFLDIQQGMDLDAMRAIRKKGGKYKNLECDNSACYRIRAITYRRGKWEALRDKEGKALYWLVKLDTPYEQKSTFEVILSNGPYKW
ncbi:hypothetical protein [Chitinophaga qingshengii]|uniref:VCBS repeat-containing protein n=1 Tax=Chitinophaga qingshengii TaxID=1569794 RepID=A0ABR7TJE3_9BACT|nr:hypothetical protein [Chitinophaga qingshengii]MBC9930617.1 hypothetical protein [Chitinophaga qingshengii]